MSARPERLSQAQARRIALAAQGFQGGTARRARRIDRRQLLAALDRLALLQIDSVNVLVRAHYLPLFSRLGGYPSHLLDRLSENGAGRNGRRLFEYWGHEASLLPLELHPLLRWRMAEAKEGRGVYAGLTRFAAERPGYVAEVLAEVRARGPLSASELSDGGSGSGAWWGWSAGKQALEWLFWCGEVTTASRRNFERVYDLPERVIPAEVLALPTPDKASAQRALLRRAGRALGIASERDLRDYFRLKPGDARPRLAELLEEGALLPVAVEGWREPGYLDPAAAQPRRLQTRALLSPFDPLVWERDRAERLFGFRYRLEFYTPAEKRRFGYYVLPFLLGDRLVGRVDLKADRQAGRLLVLATHAEPGVKHEAVAAALAEELAALAAWLGLEGLRIEHRGDLAPALAIEAGAGVKTLES